MPSAISVRRSTRRQRRGVGAATQFVALDPRNAAKARNQVATFDNDAVQVEIAEPGILRTRRMTGRKAGSGQRLIAALGATDDGKTRSGQRLGKAGGRLEQERDARLGVQVLGVLSQVR